MGGQCPGPIPNQQTHMCRLYDVQHAVYCGCRDAPRAYVHAQCVKGSLKSTNEFFPKNPTADQEAVDSVFRLRDSVLSAAAGAEVVLPIHDPQEDNSTVAPDDED